MLRLKTRLLALSWPSKTKSRPRPRRLPLPLPPSMLLLLPPKRKMMAPLWAMTTTSRSCRRRVRLRISR